MSRKIKKLIEKKNRMRRDKGKAFGAKKNSKADTCHECGHKIYFKRDCYKLKNKLKRPKHEADFRDKRKSKALLT